MNKRALTMNPKNEGLTVGELSIAIATLIIISFIWSTFNNSQNKNNNAKINRELISEIRHI